MKSKLVMILIASSLFSTQAMAFTGGGYIKDKAAQFGKFLSDWGNDTGKAPAGQTTPTLKPNGVVGNDCLNKHKQLADANVKAQNDLIDSIVKPAPKGIGEMPCFDKYKNFSLSVSVGIPSLNGLLDQFKNQACQFVDSQVSQAGPAPLNSSVWMPGGMGQVNTWAVFNGTKSSTGGVATKGAVGTSGGLTLPQIFK